MTRSLGLALLSFGTAVLLLAGPATAETILLENGKTLLGEVVEADDQSVVIRLTGGSTLALSRDRIERIIEDQASPSETLVDLEKRLPRKDTHALYRLSQWAAENKLQKDHERLLWQTLELSPDHEGARAQLGFQALGKRWFTPDDYQLSQGQLCLNDTWKPSADLRAALEEEHGADALASGRDLFRTASGKGKSADRMQALEDFRALPRDVQSWTLMHESIAPDARRRQFAVRELGTLGDQGQGALLRRVAVTDDKRAVRDEALRVLQQWGNPDTALSFIPYLNHRHEAVRTNAANALSVFPDRRAVGPLVETTQAVWGGFGRVHFSQLVQRAYVKDYELVSGGTGLVVQEVADPVVDTFMEGIVLDIDTRRVVAESHARAGALSRATGRTFGANFEKWESWWNENAGTAALANAGR